MNRFVGDASQSKPTKFKVGRGSTAFSVADTDLEDHVPITGTEQVDDCEATTGWTDSADMTVSVNSSTYKQGSNSLNTTKDGTSSTDASTYKTTTSLDFTDKELSIWFYVKDSTALAKLETTDAITIRFGSDSSNYYEWTFDNSDLSTGWNLLQNMTSSSSSTTGTPTITACDYSFIQLTATGTGITWSDGDFVMDDWKLASSDDFFGSLESGYPSIDTTNNEITYRYTLDSTQANGYNLTETGLFNTDTTPKIWNRDTFTSFSKSDTEELRFIIKDKVAAN